MRRDWIKYLNFLFSLVVVFLLVNVFFFLRSYGKEKAYVPPAPVAPEAIKKSQKSPADYAVISKRNLFNVEDTSKPAVSAQPLSLKLKGTVVGVQEFTFCIIEDKSKRKEELYQKGDKIQDMEITDITVNSVVLKRGTEQLVLYIDEEEKNVQAKGKENEGVVASKTAYPNLADLEHPSPDKWVVSKEDVLQATRNISEIMSDFKIRPHFSSGKMEGFAIDDVKEASIVSTLGIKKGDVVTRVNGEVIDSPKKVFDLYRNLEKTSVIQLEVERGDSTEVLTYEIK